MVGGVRCLEWGKFVYLVCAWHSSWSLQSEQPRALSRNRAIHDQGALAVDKNWTENQIRPVVVQRNNWMFAGSLRAGQRTATVMSLIQSARLSGHDPHVYLN